MALSPRIRRDLAAFAPNVVHISSPDLVGHRAVSWARARRLPVLASVHTRFETYLRYYNMAWAEPIAVALLRRLYRRCDALVAPSESFAQVLREQRMNYDINIWSRGVDREVFHSCCCDMRWRRGLGIGDDEFVIGSLSCRLVLEKGLDVFADTIDDLRRAGVPYRVLVVGDGPARGWFRAACPMRCSPASLPTPTWRAPLPAWTYCSTPRSPRHSATSLSRRWPAVRWLPLRRRAAKAW